MQLVRHTIEYISSRKKWTSLDAETKAAIEIVCQATPTYDLKRRNEIININETKVVNHPYYSKYRALQNLCLAILKHRKAGVGNGNGQQIHGILFDGAWLWEEYLNTVLHPLGFLHPENKIGHGGINLFTTCPKHTIYPDFYKPEEIVADAKYKKYAETDENGNKKREVAREDLYQVITYMFRLKVKRGLILCPCSSQDEFHNPYIFEDGLGEIAVCGLNVSDSKGGFAEYQLAMAISEDKFRKAVKQHLKES